MSSMVSTTINPFLDSQFRYVLIPVFYIIFFILGFISNLYVLFVLIRGIIVCICIWVFVLTMSLPFLVSPGINVHSKNNTDIRRCFEGYQGGTNDKKKKVAVTHFLIIGSFFVVFLLIVMCNFLIAQSLISKNSPQSESQSSGTQSKKPTVTFIFKRPTGVKRRALQMLLAVVGVFVLCFLPHHIVQGPWVLAVLEIEDGFGHVKYSETTRQLLNDAHQITLVLMGLNCILDPVVYYFATGKFRGEIKAHIKKLIP
ncbi:platelet-activating factor receptor-like [Neolamprologus brichardi]|uniref:platelet-activating factor receptor-like n=1 Tax=Neolamprologus brichardi TaxID=32507 RepID=UPI001643CF35|nr:platelet-activating factor receptor-like [Neolamprologus brichardi]